MAVQISGARVKLSDAPRGVMERLLRLSGSPEQVQAAVNLVQVRIYIQHTALFRCAALNNA